MRRSLLCVPGNDRDKIDRAAASAADGVLLDLEDSVLPADKPAARQRVIEALNDIDWRARGQRVAVRINAIDSPHMYRDLVDIGERAGGRVDSILLPKADGAADLYALDRLLAQIESAMGHGRRIGLEALIESARGLANVEAIGGAVARLDALHFGVADFAADCRARVIDIGADDPAQPWSYPMSRLLVACRANGLEAVDGPFGAIDDDAGLTRAARRAAASGYDGKWVIHPRQIDTVNRVFSPSPDELERARRILRALADAAAAGQGTARLDGRMIDAVSARLAQNLLDRDAAIRARRGALPGSGPAI